MSSYGVVHLLQPSGSFLRIEVVLPPTHENGEKEKRHVYQWVHERLLEEKVDSAQAMQEPFLVCASPDQQHSRAPLPSEQLHSQSHLTWRCICSSHAQTG